MIDGNNRKIIIRRWVDFFKDFFEIPIITTEDKTAGFRRSCFNFLSPGTVCQKITAYRFKYKVLCAALAAEAADPAENLPDGAANGVAVGVAIEEKHLADLLFRICLAKTGWIVTDL